MTDDARDRFTRLATATAPAEDQPARAARVAAFCDAVDTENTDHRRYLPLAYQEATVLDGSHGVLVIATSVYRMLRIEAEARVGDDVTVTHGAELLLDERDLRNDTAWTGSTYGV